MSNSKCMIIIILLFNDVKRYQCLCLKFIENDFYSYLNFK